MRVGIQPGWVTVCSMHLRTSPAVCNLLGVGFAFTRLGQILATNCPATAGLFHAGWVGFSTQQPTVRLLRWGVGFATSPASPDDGSTQLSPALLSLVGGAFSASASGLCVELLKIWAACSPSTLVICALPRICRGAVAPRVTAASLGVSSLDLGRLLHAGGPFCRGVGAVRWEQRGLRTLKGLFRYQQR